MRIFDSMHIKEGVWQTLVVIAIYAAIIVVTYLAW
jgi:hypothetical protein